MQNHIQLKRQEIAFKKNLKELADCNPTREDFETQRLAYKLIVDKLITETDKTCKNCINDCDVQDKVCDSWRMTI